MRGLTRARRTSMLLALCLAETAAEAREPGIAPLYPPGQSLGVPIAVPLPPGVYFGLRSAYYNAALIGNDGRYFGQHFNIVSEAFQLIWSPGWKILGASYRMLLVQPFAYVSQARTDPLPSALRGNSDLFAPANLKFHFLDLSWPLGEGFYVGAGLSVYFPTGQWSSTSPIKIGANFWTFEPSLALTYFQFPWSATLHAVYNTNTTNPQNRYYSGDQLFLNFYAVRNVAGFNIGPVAYWQKQVTGDFNGGGLASFGGITAPPPEQYAVGAMIGRQFEKAYVQFMFTQDVYARNTLQGSKA